MRLVNYARDLAWVTRRVTSRDLTWCFRVKRELQRAYSVATCNAAATSSGVARRGVTSAPRHCLAPRIGCSHNKKETQLPSHATCNSQIATRYSQTPNLQTRNSRLAFSLADRHSTPASTCNEDVRLTNIRVDIATSHYGLKIVKKWPKVRKFYQVLSQLYKRTLIQQVI